MNVFDVLREKFKHKKKILIDLSNEYRDNDKRLSTGYANKALAMGDAIEIVNQVEQEYNGSLPKPIPLESADYAHEASYIQGWNDCLEKIIEK